MSTVPIQVIAAPVKIWIANRETPDPGIGHEPGVDWNLFAHPNEISENGVKINLGQQFLEHRVDGLTMVKKAFRTAESLEVEFEIDRFGAASLSKILSNALVRQSPSTGIPGKRTISFVRGNDVRCYSLLIEGPSTVLADDIMRIYIPCGFWQNNIEVTFAKNKVALLPLKFMAIWSPTAATGNELGYLYEADAPAT